MNCVLKTCKAKTEQNLSKNGCLEDIAAVKVPHNHKRETEDNIRRQMFIYSMTRRIQHDKTLNIRSIYEEMLSK